MKFQRTLLALAAASLATGAFASSHREAPSIAQNPSVDGTDFYMFRSYEPGRSGFCWLSCGAQPESQTISKVARRRPSGSAKRSA